MNTTNKENDLLQLQQFSQQRNTIGWCANIWFNGLIYRYPFHFLVYAEHTNGNDWRKDIAKQNIKREIINKVDEILSMPLDQKDIVAYEKLISTFNDFIQKKQNNNP